MSYTFVRKVDGAGNIIAAQHINELQSAIEDLSRRSPFANYALTPTIYALPGGLTTGTGSTRATAVTLQRAHDISNPGDVIGVMNGEHLQTARPWEVSRGGNAGAWITYLNVDGGAIIKPDVSAHGGVLFETQPGVAYVRFLGLTLDGSSPADDVTQLATGGITVKGGHHIWVEGCTIKNCSSAGIASVPGTNGNPATSSDYIYAIGNLIHNCGYVTGNASGIHFNGNQFASGDTYPGFHSVVAYNVISGQYDAGPHTDGNGVVNEYASIAATPTTCPACLICNNVTWLNGGRGFHALYCSNTYFINNTSYKVGQDTARANSPGFQFFDVGGTPTRGWAVNNIAYTTRANDGFTDTPTAVANYRRNIWFSSGSATNQLTGTGAAAVLADATQLRNRDPLFVRPIVVNESGGHYATATAPWNIGDAFFLTAASLAIGDGVDPTTLGFPVEINTGIRAWCYRDVLGNPRPVGGPFDLGAYQYHS